MVTNQDNTIDPKVKNLVQAIGQTETGGEKDPYNAKGASGEFGRYQFMPETYKNYAQKYLGDSKAAPTVENQNRIAYSFVKEKKDAGYNPAQIASMWNAGEGKPDAYKGNAGVNAEGVAYDTAAYARKVSNYYEQYSSGQTPTDEPSTQTTAPVDDNKITAGKSFIGKIASSIVPLGVDRGQTMALNDNENLYEQAVQQNTDLQNKIRESIDTKKKAGVDTSHLEHALQLAIQSTPKQEEFTGTLPTPEHIVGDALQTGLSATAAGIPGVGEATGIVGKVAEGAAVGAGIGGIGSTASAMQQDASVGNVTKNAGEGLVVGGLLGGAISGIAGAAAGRAVTPVETVMDNIAPKETAAEARLAMKQGRLVGATEPGLFSAGSPGEIIPTAKVQQAAQTVVDNIPGAEKMDQPKLFNAINNKIGEIAQALRPEMQKVVIQPQAIEKLGSDWESLKITQFEDASATDEPNVVKIQKQFQKVLDSIKSDTSLDKVWDARIDYDNSIPNNVKKANSLSSDWLNTQRSIWLKNRELLNNIINDTATGLGEKSQKAFSDMSDMYTAQNGLLTKAKGTITAQPSRIAQWVKNNPIKAKALKYGAIAVGLGETGKHIGSILP